MKRLVRAAVANLRREPSHAAELVSQLVLGEEASVLEEAGGWARGAGADGYEGWVHARSLVPAGEPPPAGARLVWTRRDGVLREGPDPDAAPLCDLVIGARLLPGDDGGGSEGHARAGWLAARLPGGGAGWGERGGWVEATALEERFPRRAEALVETALSLRGVPYLWGGTSSKAFDCSGFVQRVFGLHGVPLPRDAWQQAEVGQPVAPGDSGATLQAGDLLFFAEGGRRVTHVGIALGGAGRIVHSSTGRAGVAVDSLLPGDALHSPDLAASVAGARRLL